MSDYTYLPNRTTTEEILILFPYHKEGIPVSVPIVSKVQCSPQYKIHRKNTDLYCFEYIIEGTQYIITDKKYKASTGDFCIIHGNGKHLYYADKNNPPKKASICVYGNLIKELLVSYNITQTIFPNTNVLHIFENLFQQKKDDLDYNYFCQKTAMAIHELIHAILTNNQNVSIPNYIIQAKKLLENSLKEPLNLNLVCKTVGISKPQLIKGFKQYYGTTPYRYFLDLKINTAKLLLVNTDSSIKEIAYSLKFPDEYHFSNLFKEKVGTSPISYRKANK